MKHLPQHACLRFGFWMTNNSDIAVRIRPTRTNFKHSIPSPNQHWKFQLVARLQIRRSLAGPLSDNQTE